MGFLTVVVAVLALLLAAAFYVCVRLINEVTYLRDELQEAADTEHVKCMAAVMAFVGDEFAAQVLAVAADDYDSVEEAGHMKVLARTQYREGGPSMPSIWLRDRADRLRILAGAEESA